MPGDPEARAVLSKHQHHVLYTVGWGVKHFGGLVTGGDCRRRDMLALARRGLVRSNGTVAVCDDDGFVIMPERYREAWVLTDAGIAALRRAAGGEDAR